MRRNWGAPALLFATPIAVLLVPGLPTTCCLGGNSQLCVRPRVPLSPSPLQVNIIREAALTGTEMARLCAHLLVGGAKAGKTWQLAQDAQVYFLKVAGVCDCTPD